MDFKKAMKQARIKNRITLRILSRNTGLKVGHLADIESGRKHPSDADKMNIGKTLDMEVVKPLCGFKKPGYICGEIIPMEMTCSRPSGECEYQVYEDEEA